MGSSEAGCHTPLTRQGRKAIGPEPRWRSGPGPAPTLIGLAGDLPSPGDGAPGSVHPWTGLP